MTNLCTSTVPPSQKRNIFWTTSSRPAVSRAPSRDHQRSYLFPEWLDPKTSSFHALAHAPSLFTVFLLGRHKHVIKGFIEGSGGNGDHGLSWVFVGLFSSMSEQGFDLLRWKFLIQEEALAGQLTHVLFVVQRLTQCVTAFGLSAVEGFSSHPSGAPSFASLHLLRSKGCVETRCTVVQQFVQRSLVYPDLS